MTNKIFAFFAGLALAFAAQAEVTTWNFYTDAAVAADPIDGGTALYGKTMYVVGGSLGTPELWDIVNARDAGNGESPLDLGFVLARIDIDADSGIGVDADFPIEGSGDASTSAFYLVMVMRAQEDAGHPLYGKYFMSSPHAATDFDDWGEDFNLSAQFAQTADMGHWRALPIPEPTSGLLFLFGLAGLALKRRRG